MCIGEVGFLGVKLLDVVLEDPLRLCWCGIELDFEDGVILNLVDAHVVEVLVDVEEQVDVVSGGEE